MSIEVYEVRHSSPELKTVGDYVAEIDSPAHMYVDKESDFLQVKNSQGITNETAIQMMICDPLEANENLQKSPRERLIKPGTIFAVPTNKINLAGLLTQGIEVVSNNVPAFKAQQLVLLENEPSYSKVYESEQSNVLQGVTQVQYPDATVWVWCRGLSKTYSTKDYQKEVPPEMEGELFDLSPFIISVNTSVGKNGGSFNIVLPPLTCEIESTTENGQISNRWVVKSDTMKIYSEPGLTENDFRYLSQNNLFKDIDSSGEKPQPIKNQFLFHNIISSNDLVLIRFETLQLESSQREEDSKLEYLNKDKIAGRVYDMIGLVDVNEKGEVYNNNDVTITISGRDLIKLFIEDGAYFYNLENITGQFRLVGESTRENEEMRRIVGDNSLLYLNLYNNASIEHVLEFIIQQLTNTGIVPTTLFDSYGKYGGEDRRNYRYVDKKSTTPQVTQSAERVQEKKLASGVWQIVKLIIDSGVTDRRIVDSSISSANGSLLNFIRKVCQEPFVEFYTDTYGDMFYITVRKPPYDRLGIQSMLEGQVVTEKGKTNIRPAVVEIDSKDVIREDLVFNDSEAYSWYNFRPQNVYAGGGSVLPALYTPALFFKEYAKVWGSRPLDLVHNYNPYISTTTDKGISDISRYEEQAILDLKFVVESHAYLPFTRRGTIVINGDRRIKKGNVIRYLPTGEIFIVDQVTQNIVITDRSIDRTTTIVVSRGMIEELIYGVDLGDIKNISYFNIINTDFQIKKKQYNEEYEVEEPVTIKNTTSSNTQTNLTPGETILVSPGFNEYIQHQQGPYGAKLIINAAKKDGTVPLSIQKNMASNVHKDFKSPLTPRTFLKYLIQDYNTKYKEAQSNFSSFDGMYQKVAAIEQVPLDSLRTMGYIESSHGKNLGGDSYYGIMQLSKEVAQRYSVDRYDNYQNIVGGARFLKSNSRNILIGSSFIFSPTTNSVTTTDSQDKIEYKKVKKTRKFIGIDQEEVFSKFKVNREIFDWFLRKEQFNVENFKKTTQIREKQGL